MRVEAILARLKAVKRNGNGWMALCPSHDDHDTSLSIDEHEGKILLYCHAGCSFESVLSALGIEARELFNDSGAAPRIVAEHGYLDENGKLLFQVVRFEPKSFRQRRPDGGGSWTWNLNGTRRVLYNLPAVLAASDVLVVEGEKDANTGNALGLVATCNPGGAGKWREEYSESLRGKRIAVIADADEPGRKHAQQVAASLFGNVESLKVLELPGAKDLSEWKSKYNFSRDALLDLISKALEWKPTAETPALQPGAVLRCFADIEPQEVRWLWPGRIPLGKLSLLIGDPGLGKSLLTDDIVARLTLGKSFPDGATCEPGSAIILSAEDEAEDTVRPRLDAAGADVSRVHNLEAVRVQLADGSLTEKSFNLETDVAHFEATLRAHPEVRLIVIDPVSAYLGGADSYSNAEVRGLLAPLAALAARHDVAVLCITHLRKSAGAAVYRAIASIAFTAAARAVWAVAADPEEAGRRLLLAVKQNLSANMGGLAFRIETQNGVPRLAWEHGAVDLSANEVLNVDAGQDQSECRGAVEWLRDFLADGPVGAGEAITAAAKLGIKKTTLWRAASSLRIVKRKLGGRGAAWEWSLKDSSVKESTHRDVEVDSLDSLTKPMQTKADSEAQISKNPPVESMDSLKFGDDGGGEVRL